MDILKVYDINKNNLYIIDEVHNFINNVYNNMISKESSSKALNIYNYILDDKKNNN
jgi:superfamily II DNA or RNA helicase